MRQLSSPWGFWHWWSWVLCWFDLGETARGGGIPMRQQIATLIRCWRAHSGSGAIRLARPSAPARSMPIWARPFVGNKVLQPQPGRGRLLVRPPSVAMRWEFRLRPVLSVVVGMNRMI